MNQQSSLNAALTRRLLLKSLTIGAGVAIESPFVLKRAHAAENPIATTRAGKIKGYVDNGISVFKGVPYGDDPSKRRFMAALPAKPWSGVRDCLEWGPQAPKPVTPPRQNTNSKAPSKAPVS